MRRRRLLTLIASSITAVAILLAASCSRHDPAVLSGTKPKVVATISIIGDWVKTVGADDIELTTLVGADGDPHDYEPVPADSRTLGQATLIFENGFGLEHWLDKLYQSADGKATRVVITNGVVVRHVPDAEGERPNGNQDDRDPHAMAERE